MRKKDKNWIVKLSAGRTTTRGEKFESIRKIKLNQVKISFLVCVKTKLAVQIYLQDIDADKSWAGVCKGDKHILTPSLNSLTNDL